MAGVRFATSVAEAVAWRSQDADSVFMAGGQTLLPAIKQRLAAPSTLILLERISGLKQIAVSRQLVRIGAMVTHDDVANHPDIGLAIPSLAWLARHIGDPAVRNQGTLGGSVANNDPAACYPGACLALDARIATSNNREVAAEDFFAGTFATCLEESELVTAVSFQIPLKSAYVKFAQPASRYPLVGVYLAYFPNRIRVAVTGAAHEGAFRCGTVERAVAGGVDAVKALAAETLDDGQLTSDIHATPAYRAALMKALTLKAMAKLEPKRNG